MYCPFPFTSLAEYLDFARRRLFRGVEHDLHLPALFIRLVFVLEDHRVVQLEILHDY